MTIMTFRRALELFEKARTAALQANPIGKVWIMSERQKQANMRAQREFDRMRAIVRWLGRREAMRKR
jgi:hypothetical protein